MPLSSGSLFPCPAVTCAYWLVMSLTGGPPSTGPSREVRVPDTTTIIMSTAFGAAFGAIAGHLGDTYRHHRRERLALRRRVLGEMIRLTSEYEATLYELHIAREAGGGKITPEVRQQVAHAARHEGTGMHLEIQFAQAFRSRKIRAAFHKLLNRLDRSKELILQPDCPSADQVELALAWIKKQGAQVMMLALKKAGIDPVTPGGVIFVGFRKVTYEDKQMLSFEDEAPPWEFSVNFHLHGPQMGPELLEKAKGSMRAKVGDLRCPTHGRPAHIICTGTMNNLTIEYAVCCEKMHELVHAKLNPTGNQPVSRRRAH